MNKLYDMKLSKIYHLLVNKALKKGRDKKEVDELIFWLLGYNEDTLNKALNDDICYGDFFTNAPKPNEKRYLITGTICKIKISEIEDPTYQDMRRLDKMVDDLAKGKSLDKILL